MPLKYFIPALSIALLTACADTPQPSWQKEGFTTDDTLTVLSQCEYEVGLHAVSALEQPPLIRSCMQSKGFRWRAAYD